MLNDVPRPPRKKRCLSSFSVESYIRSRSHSVESSASSDEDPMERYTAWCRKPGPFSVFTHCWEKLPAELRDLIYDLLAGSNKAGAVRLSTVSEAWSRQFRPLLFAHLVLKSEDECRVLYDIIRSPLSAWLAEHVTSLKFDNSAFPGHPLSIALLRLLPACRTICHRAQCSKPLGRMSYSAALKSSLRNVTSLTLTRCNFPSFRILLRMLADITHLEAVNFETVKWSGDAITTVEAAKDICTGAFSHVRKVKLRDCTDNMAVPAWILAAASTRYSFTRRRISGPAVPAETWVIIELIRTFLGDGVVNKHSRFDVIEATPDAYRFVGFLSSTLHGTFVIANVSVQVVRSTLPDGNDEAWSVRQITIADSKAYKASRPYLRSRDWSTITSLLPTLPRLHQFQILCGCGHSEENLHALSDKVRKAVNNHSRITIQHDPKMPDGRFLQPALFDLNEEDLATAQKEKVRVRKCGGR